ncbi:MAG: hypothetical protein HQL71_06605 [Magnetococcales bacterium]|nr:hypothetical protein [Magnetococcales bacterium]
MMQNNMSLNVYEDEKTGEAVVTVGQRLDSTVIKEFMYVVSLYEQDRKFIINLIDVDRLSFASLELLLLLSGCAGSDRSRFYVTRCNHNAINSAVKFPLFK